MSEPAALVEITSEVVSAYLANNHVPPADIPGLIATVHVTFAGLGTAPQAAVEPERVVPAVPVKKSVTDEYLICLDDGRKFKSLKRHIGQLGMTPDQYRAKWGLPSDYPMTCASYAAKRSELAKTIGLGRKR